MSSDTAPTTFKDRLRGVSKKLKLDSHYQIERYGIGLLVMVIIGAILIGTAGVTAFQKSRANLGATAIYTSSFTTSKTAVEGQVAGIYTSEDRTQAFVLMHFDNVAQISTNADNYQAFMTGIDQKFNNETLKGDPSGQLYMFGSTGYMGVLLTNPEGFENQILNLTLRANEQIVTPEKAAELDDDLVGDSSFAQYDQWRVVVNPGATGAEVSEALTEDPTNVRGLYDEMVIAPQEAEIRSTMDEQLSQMRTQLAAIDEYTNRLVSTKFGDDTLAAPEVPEQIKGDEILCDGKSLRRNSNELNSCEPEKLSLKTEWVAPDGYDFDWRTGSVNRGYLDQIVPADSSYLAYLGEHRAEDYDDMKTSEIEFKLADGTLLVDSPAYQNTDAGPVKSVNDNIALLTDAYDMYYDTKKAYQVDSHNELLDLEVGLRDVESNYSINEDTDSVLTY